MPQFVGNRRQLTGSAELSLLGGGLLKLLDRALRRFEHLTRAIPATQNPLLQPGAVANTCFLIAVASGILLLFWYVPSVHQAHGSVVAMDQDPWLSGLMRSLHRYSSDATMMFVLFHAVRVFVAGRFTGPRWLAWITGLALLPMLWFVGWLGYWLVWDQRGQQVALGTTQVLDALPLFSDPLSRAFLTDSTVSSLLFFVVFFAHMLIPLGMGIALWIHITRLARSKFFTSRSLTIWITLSLVLVSILVPANTAQKAQMQVPAESLTMDWWYLVPLVVTDRLGTGALWMILLVVGAVLYSMPWWMRRRGQTLKPAKVEVSRCNSCQQCYSDCPYNAISMVPRTDDKVDKYEFNAQVNPNLCVGCGICSGSCDSVGVDLDWFDVIEQRRIIEGWLEASGDDLALVCAHSAGATLKVDPDTGGCPELPGYRVMTVPCAGWVHALTVERAQQRGAKVLIGACSDGACRYREGPKWLQMRLAGTRKPSLRPEKADTGKIQVVQLDSWQKDRLVADARSFAAGSKSKPGLMLDKVLAAAAVLILLAALMVVVSDLYYAPPQAKSPELVVSFKHPGAVRLGRLLTPEEKAKYPAYMKRERVMERGRTPVRMRIFVDGKERLNRSYDPTGLWGDGNSLALERLPIEAGTHEIRIEIGETTDPEEWTYRSESKLDFTGTLRRVVLFNRAQGFAWH